MKPLLEDVRHQTGGDAPNLIIFSGDLIYGEVNGATVDAQITEARAWLERLHELWGKALGDLPILFVPGNHDVKRSDIEFTQTSWLHSLKSSADLETMIKTGNKTWTRILERQDAWWDFTKSIPKQSWRYDEALRISSGVFERDGIRIGVVGFNTSWSCCEDREKGKLWFTRHQFLTGFDTVQDCDIRIAVLHHPVSWLHESEESWLEQKFEANFHLLFHGHTHSGWYRHQGQHATISAGACWTGSTEENGYYLIRLTTNPASVELHARTYIDKGLGQWSAVNLPGKFSVQGTVRLPLSAKSHDIDGEHSQSQQDTAEIVGIADISATFPAQHEPWISREETLTHLQENFDFSTNLVLVTGRDGAGKSVMAAQLVRHLPLSSICLFLRPSPHWSTQLAHIRLDLCNQMHWLLKGEEMELGAANEINVSQYLQKLQRYARQRRSPFYIVIDGLNHFTSPSSPPAISDVLALFESFTPYFRFVICLEPEFLPTHYRALPYHTFKVPRFEKGQCIAYLEGIVNEQQVEEIWKLTQGRPSVVASIRRILKRDPTITIDRLSDKLPDLFNFEWGQVDEKNSNQLLLLAALALFPSRFTAENLTAILDIPEPEVAFAVQAFEFLNAVPQDGTINFSSDALRAFVGQKLKRFEQTIRSKIIDHLMERPESAESLQEIPLYLSDAGRDSELLEYLSPDHLERLLHESQSWQQAIEQATLALSAASKTDSIREFTRFALHKSSLCQFQRSDSGRSATEALLALGRMSDAVVFAESQMTRESRLLLLAVIARVARERSLLLPPSVGETIQKLSQDLPQELAADIKLELATELITTYPELALRILESFSKERGSIDSALARVSISAFLQRETDPHLEDNLDDISAKIGSEKTRRFTAAAQLVLGRTTTAAVLTKVKALASPHDQIFLLRQWAVSHPKTPDARPILEYALELVVKSPDFVPNARALRELAAPLPYLSKEYPVLILAGRFSEQLQLVKNRGFTEDYVHLQLIIAHTEATFAEAGFKERLDSLYFDVNGIEDISIRSSCLALMSGKVLEIESDPNIGEANRLYPALLHDLEEAFAAMLQTTADHYSAARSTILHVHAFDSKRSIGFAKQLNTEPRRNKAYSDLAVAEIKKPAADAAVLQTLMQAITYRDLYEETLGQIVSAVGRERDKQISADLLHFLVQSVTSITDADRRTHALVRLLTLKGTGRDDVVTRDQARLLSELRRSWEAIDELGARREAGLHIVTELADTLPEVASEYWKAATELAAHSGISELGFSRAVFHNVLLAIRFFRGLIPKGVASASDRQAVIHQIERLPSLTQRVLLLGELALAYIRNKKGQEANSLVAERIQPLLDQIAQNDRSQYERTYIEVAPALYATYASSTRQRLLTFDPFRRDLAVRRIIHFILDKLPPDDPFQSNTNHDYRLSDNELLDLVELLGIAEDDSLVYMVICKIVDTVASARGKKTYTRQLNTDLATQLMKLVAEKFPNSRFIRHQGYAIVAKAEIARFSGIRDDDFDALLKSGRDLPNIADRAYVVALLAATLPVSRAAVAKSLVKEALDLVDGLTTFEDRVERYQAIGEIATAIDKTLSRDAFRRAAQYVGAVENWRGGAYARRLVDAAFKLDKSFAEEISSRLTFETAKAELPKAAKERSSRSALREKITGSDDLDKLSVSDLEILDDVIWSLWGEINAGKAAGLKFQRCRQLIHVASKLPLRDAFRVWVFVAENLCSLYENTNQAESYLRQLFEATLVNGELAFRIGSLARARTSNDIATSFEEFATGVTVVPAGARQKAVDEIEQWCLETVDEYLLIIDPTFRERDLSLVETVKRARPDCGIVVITSKGVQSVDAGVTSVEEAFKRQWVQSAGGLEPTGVEIVLVGLGLTGELPVNSRALISRRGGLLIEASYSQLALAKETRLRRVSAADAGKIEQGVDLYLDPRKALAAGQKLSVSRFTIL